MAKNNGLLVPTKSASLYGGNVIVDFYQEKHQYVIREKSKGGWVEKYPYSVTTATGIVDKSGPLMYWAVNQARDFLINLIECGTDITQDHVIEASRQHTIKKAEAASIGTLVHEWAEEHIKGTNPPMPDDPRVLNGVTAFLKWITDHDVRFVSTEKLVYSRKYGYSGLMDCEFTLGEEKHKIVHAGDFKTSKGFYKEFRFQVSAYQAASVEESGQKYGDKWLMKFDKETANFDARPFGDQAKDFKAFLACLDLRKRVNEITKEEKANAY